MHQLCSPPIAHPISLCRCRSRALGVFLWSREEILKGNKFAPLRSRSVLSISFTRVQDSWTQKRQEQAARTSRLIWWGPTRGLSRVQSDYAEKNEWALSDLILLPETKRVAMLFRILKNWGIKSRTGLTFHQICFELWNRLPRQSPLILCHWKISFWGFQLLSHDS